MTLYPVEKREVLWKDPNSSEKKQGKPKKLKKEAVFKMGKERKDSYKKMK